MDIKVLLASIKARKYNQCYRIMPKKKTKKNCFSSGCVLGVYLLSILFLMKMQQLYCIYRFRIVFILLSSETILKSYRFQAFSCRCKVKKQRKVCGFDNNDMKASSCWRGPRRS